MKPSGGTTKPGDTKIPVRKDSGMNRPRLWNDSRSRRTRDSRGSSQECRMASHDQWRCHACQLLSVRPGNTARGAGTARGLCSVVYINVYGINLIVLTLNFSQKYP